MVQHGLSASHAAPSSQPVHLPFWHTVPAHAHLGCNGSQVPKQFRQAPPTHAHLPPEQQSAVEVQGCLQSSHNFVSVLQPNSAQPGTLLHSVLSDKQPNMHWSCGAHLPFEHTIPLQQEFGSSALHIAPVMHALHLPVPSACVSHFDVGQGSVLHSASEAQGTG